MSSLGAHAILLVLSFIRRFIWCCYPLALKILIQESKSYQDSKHRAYKFILNLRDSRDCVLIQAVHIGMFLHFLIFVSQIM